MQTKIAGLYPTQHNVGTHIQMNDEVYEPTRYLV